MNKIDTIYTYTNFEYMDFLHDVLCYGGGCRLRSTISSNKNKGSPDELWREGLITIEI